MSRPARTYKPLDESSIVYVFPLPVWPYAKQVALPPVKMYSTRGNAVLLYTCSLSASQSNTSSKVNECCSENFVKSTLTFGSVTTIDRFPTTAVISCSFFLTSFLLSGRFLTHTLIRSDFETRLFWEEDIVVDTAGVFASGIP